ncbi:hypothetical protein TNCV_4297521 [Trichonephila clavipes]|nr:hypothetical protein TNCV_4297521 [Trichonephila clavipes]
MSNGSWNAECEFVHHITKWQLCLKMQSPMQISIGRIFILVRHPKMHLVPPFGVPALASSVPEGRGSAIAGHNPEKLLEFLKSNFRFLFPTQKNSGRALYTLQEFQNCLSQNTPEIKFSLFMAFEVMPCQEVSTIRSSSIVRQSYGYFGDSIRNSGSTFPNIPVTDFSCTLVHKFRYRKHTRIPTFCEFSHFPDSSHFRH